MSPNVALLLTFSFVITILVLDHKANKEFSLALWIPTLWLLYSTSKQIGVWLNIETTMEAGSSPDRMFLLSLGFLALIILIRRSVNILTLIRGELFFGILILYVFLSTLWAKSPEISLRRLLRDFISFLVIFIVASEKDPVVAALVVFRRSIYIALPFSLVLIKYFPALGRQYSVSGELMWTGIAPQKNELALFCAFSILFLVWGLYEKNIKILIAENKLSVLINFIMMVLAIYLFLGPKHKLTHSATSFVALIMGLLITKISFFRKKKVFFAILLTLFILGTITPFAGKVPALKWIPNLLGRSDTLTGRINIWNALVPYAKNHLFFGHGFGGFWTTGLRRQIAVTAHNGYLDTILNLGITGLILFLLFIIRLANKIMQYQNFSKEISSLWLGFVIMLAVHNFAESSLGYFSVFPTSLVLFFISALPVLERKSMKIE